MHSRFSPAPWALLLAIAGPAGLGCDASTPPPEGQTSPSGSGDSASTGTGGANSTTDGFVRTTGGGGGGGDGETGDGGGSSTSGGSGGSGGSGDSSGTSPPTDGAACGDGVLICADFVDDDCDGTDEACPTTQAAVTAPNWDCSGEPPAGVVAVARFGDRDCMAFFESPAGAIYVAPLRADPVGATECSGFDERRYAFTLSGEADECEPISIDADFGDPPELAHQPVSNGCRKFLHSMDSEFSYVAANVGELRARVEAFPVAEIACLNYIGWPYDWSSDLTASIEIL